jgi:hypothetical protein
LPTEIYETIICREFWGSVWLDFGKMKKKLCLNWNLKVHRKNQKAITRISWFWQDLQQACFCDHFSLNSSLTYCQLWAIGDHHHVLKSSLVFSNFLALTGNLPDYELKMENRLLWWKMFGALVGSWNEVF